MSHICQRMAIYFWNYFLDKVYSSFFLNPAFPLFLLLCFSAFLLLRFLSFLLLCFSASPFCFFFVFPASLLLFLISLFCFAFPRFAFPASLLFWFFAFLYTSTFFFAVMRFCCSASSCSFASPASFLHCLFAFLSRSLYSLLFASLMKS